jgi:hypothetical protein
MLLRSQPQRSPSQRTTCRILFAILLVSCILIKTLGTHQAAAGAYDHTRALTIDPVLSYAGYLGGNGADYGYGIAVDSSGEAYVTGYSASTTFPTVNAAQATNHGGTYDAVAFKMAGSGSSLLFSTYLGGTGQERAYGLALDPSGNAYIAGYTSSTDYITSTGVLTPCGQ